VDAVTGQGVLVDTDVFVDHLRGARRLRLPPGRAAYSVVTRCELFAGRHVDEDLVVTLLAPLHEVAIGREIAEAAGRLRRETGVRTPDALIAASALAEGLELMTRNAPDFARIPGLTVHAPRE
jgi:toxin FitB